MAEEDEGSGLGEIIIYPTEDGLARVECRFVDESLWLTQRMIAELFQTSIPNVNQPLAAIYEEGELDAGQLLRNT